MDFITLDVMTIGGRIGITFLSDRKCFQVMILSIVVNLLAQGAST